MTDLPRRSGRIAVLVVAALAVALVGTIVVRNAGMRERTPPLPAGTEKPLDPDAALSCFQQARVAGDFDAALPCMTGRLAAEIGDADGFVQGPRIVRFTVLRDERRGSRRVVVDARTFEGDRDVQAYSEDRFTMLPSGDGWLVHDWQRGPSETVGEATEVTVFLPRRDVDPCAGSGSPDDPIVGHDALEAVPRRVPQAEDQAVGALQELFTGPWAGEGDLVRAVPPRSRVLSATLEGDVVHADVNEATERGGGSCDMAVRVAAIERTLLALPGVREVVITVEGRAEDVFQP